jgi:hypothetical protein
MAVEADCLKFIALPAVQDLITNVWNGQIVYRSGFKFGFKVECFEHYLKLIY